MRPRHHELRKWQQHAQDQHSARVSTSNIVDCFKYALASTLTLHNSKEAPRAAAAAAELLAFSYEQHASLVSFLLLPTALGLSRPLPAPRADTSVRASPSGFVSVATVRGGHALGCSHPVGIFHRRSHGCAECLWPFVGSEYTFAMGRHPASTLQVLQASNAVTLAAPATNADPVRQSTPTDNAFSMLDALSASICDLAAGGLHDALTLPTVDPASPGTEGNFEGRAAAVLPVFCATATVLKHGGSCATPAAILSGQPTFWKDMTEILRECIVPQREATAAHERLQLLPYVLDAAASVLHRMRAAPPPDLLGLLREAFQGDRGQRTPGCFGVLEDMCGAQELVAVQQKGRQAAVSAGRVAALAVRP
jgi:hypothetical protein